MDTNSIYSLMDAAILIGGLYVIYLTVKMMKTGELKQNGLMSKDVDIKKCKDPDGYIKFIGPKQMLFGALAIFCGVVGLIHDYTGAIGAYMYLVFILLMVVYVVYYAAQSKKAMKMFW